MRLKQPIRLVVFDLDGTLYRGDEVIPGAPEALARLRANGILVRFSTNNSGHTRSEYASKLAGMGFEAEESEVYTAGRTAAMELFRRGFRRIFLVGEPGFVETCEEVGLQVVNRSSSGGVQSASQVDAECLLVGICRGSFSFDLLHHGQQAVFQTGRFFASNGDVTYPLAGGLIGPGAGSLVAAFRACTGQQPEIFGKPNPLMLMDAMVDAGVSPTESIMVGDRVDTDIECGLAAGTQTVLVKTGVTNPSVPGSTLVLPSVVELPEHLG